MTTPSPQGYDRTTVLVSKSQIGRLKALFPDASSSAVARRALDQFLDKVEEARIASEAAGARP